MSIPAFCVSENMPRDLLYAGRRRGVGVRNPGEAWPHAPDRGPYARLHAFPCERIRGAPILNIVRLIRPVYVYSFVCDQKPNHIQEGPPFLGRGGRPLRRWLS